MTLNGAIRQLAEMRDSEYMPIMFKPLFDKVIETVSECEEPAADVVPVRHGRWLLVRNADETGNALYECSECHKGECHVPIVSVGYCWNCGAKMDGGDGDDQP